MAGPVIGVFDSGFGGLTVLRELLPLIAGARYVYLGDTARLPYGSKSREMVARYAVSSARFLYEQGAEHLVVACNTASALALGEIEAAVPIAVTGMIGPGVAAAGAMGCGEVLVLATAATVQSGAYTRALRAAGLRAVEKACPLLVPLVEEGWLDGGEANRDVVGRVLRIYLEEARLEAPAARAMLLGCTHYPLLAGLIGDTLAEMEYPLGMVDSAEAVARVVAEAVGGAAGVAGEARFFATDSVEKFARLGSRFLGREVSGVELVDLGG